MNNNILKEFKNKSILITGGTGSIGIGLIKELNQYQPKTIRILTNDENSLFELKEKFGERKNMTYIIGDVRDKQRLDVALRNIDIVFHAAAMKHVDICEQNPFDAVKTNVYGTSNIIEASLVENISKFILISTDKATNPTTTLGASKLLAERLTINAVSYNGQGKTKFGIVRFGNVIGSRGSVFQIFFRRIQNNLPLNVTDENMTRFIMSISEAASMILDVTTKIDRGEVFVLKMPSVKIKDLAEVMIEVYQKKFNSKNAPPIKISKVREREKLFEMLVTKEEISHCRDLGKMYKISPEKNASPPKIEDFSSETSKYISRIELKKLVSELFDEYLNY